MVTIITPVKGYSGISAGIQFVDGVGETDDDYLIEWFRKKGYTIEDKEHEAKTETEDGVSGKKSTRETAKTTKKDG